MPAIATRNDGLHIQLSGADVISMCAIAPAILSGIVIINASARNGPGTGLLSMTSNGLTWQAPGSSTPGPAQGIEASGAYLLEDGADPSMWLSVQAYVDYLPASGACQVFIKDSYNALGPDDVNATNAAAGITETVEFTLKNVTANTITSVKLWLDPGTAAITVSSDGTNFYDPTSSTDAHVLTWASIASGASVNLWVKRIIASSSASSASILNLLEWEWVGIN